MTWTPPAVSCVRSAWLTLGSLTVGLEGPGWFCQSLDLGYPDVRDVVNNRPDQDGIDDRTQFFGARTVTAEITALAGVGARIDAVASQFAPFMLPGNRATLHYILDRPGAAERTMKVRAAGYSWAVVGANQRDIQLQWVADDPAATDPVLQTATAWSGSSTPPGRNYNLIFNRIYPPGSSSSTTGLMTSNGDLPVRPRIRIYGPITGAYAIIEPTSIIAIAVSFLSTFVIGAGHYVDVSVADRTAFLDGDPSQPVIASIRWDTSVWGVIPPHLLHYIFLQGASTSGVTQVQATWQDRYLS